MSGTSKPIEEWEVPYLTALARELRTLRERAGLSMGRLERWSGISDGTVSRIEAAKRRPRRSTLAALVETLVLEIYEDELWIGDDEETSELDDPALKRLTEQHLNRLVELGGPTIAAENPWYKSKHRRRLRQLKEQVEQELERADPDYERPIDATTVRAMLRDAGIDADRLLAQQRRRFARWGEPRKHRVWDERP